LRLISQLLSSENEITRRWATWIIATVVQNNPQGQEAAIQSGCMESLLKMLKEEQNEEVLLKALPATSGIFRDNSIAQDLFLKNDGVISLSNLIRHKNPRIQMRTLFFLKHIFHSIPVTKDQFREFNLIVDLCPLLQSENTDVREKTLEALMELMIKNMKNIEAGKTVLLPHLQAQLLKYKNYEKPEEYSNEIDAIQNLVELM